MQTILEPQSLIGTSLRELMREMLVRLGEDPERDGLRDTPERMEPVGSSIPVSKNCVMSITATGEVTQEGIKKLVEYLNLIKGSFPEAEDQKPN
jgi:GTP cyclohydrolase I